MEFKFRAIDGQASNSTHRPPSSSFSYFTEQAVRANYSKPESGCNHEFFRNPNDVHEAVQRELEKERIREEILAAENARRLMLEAEVRRELMVEREWALRRRVDEFPFMSGQGRPFLHQLEGRSLEERIALSLEQRFEGHTSARREFGGFQRTFQFHRNVEPKISELPKISEVEPFSKVTKEKEKDKVNLLAKPDANLSGGKRKALTPPTADAPKLPLIGWKKPKEEWSCAICQVSATSERGLNEHLQGKRHKSKEARLRAQRTGKNFGIGLVSKKTANPINSAEAENPSSEQGVKIEGKQLQHNKTREPSFLKIWKVGNSKTTEMPLSQKNQGTDDPKMKKGEAVQKVQKMGKNRKNKFKFWCEMCQAGAFSEKVMNNHKTGKKHVFRLQELKKNGGDVPGTQMVEDTQRESEAEEVVYDGKSDVSETVGGTLNGVEVEERRAATEELVIAAV